ncbi:UDP:flavonoid glycosyltransferase YjiC, YdhE family [Agromyces sp. CF514]|uniref:glycosyltransferase n=1 Tax=Agromyces sp. CF514 TaxID=1881031 RepID=UPI0008ECBEC9|nr:nucleotide disphospho-sugar-binding domain-containing protein [Agromyces sp. CF514]SFR76785.1 UDP:flavonoid glycosyltransferase YjiC, YdhE family [Agromyces sp. CF514]
MVDVMLEAMPFHGHAVPISAVAAAFTEAGHRVRVYTGSAQARVFAGTGAEVVVWRSAPDFDEHDQAATFPNLLGRKGPAQMLVNVRDLFIGTAAPQAEDLADAWAERPWDVILGDELSLGARFAAERTGTPWGTIAVTPLTLASRDLPPVGLGVRPGRTWLGRTRDAGLRRASGLLVAPLTAAYRRQRALAGLLDDGLGFDQSTYSPALTCASGIPELDWPRSDLPSSVHYVGALAMQGSPDAAMPPWWAEALVDPRPLVLVTQGTQNTDPHDLVEPAFAALGRQDVQIVAVTGRSAVDRFPFPAPPNARIAGRIPFGPLLDRASAVITNGGWGGVLATLARGIPLIVAGGDLDKPEIAARVRASGAGISLGTGRPRARAVLDAWRSISTDPGYRDAAERLARSFAQHDGPREVVARAVGLAESGVSLWSARSQPAGR